MTETDASLDGVRRIQVAIGAPDHSRSPSCISGIKLDYYNQRSPAIVGQWIQGHDLCELHDDEHVSSMAFWLSSARNIVAIRVCTTNGRSKMFLCPGCQVSLDTCDKQEYESGDYEQLVGIHFSAIVWLLY